MQIDGNSKQQLLKNVAIDDSSKTLSRMLHRCPCLRFDLVSPRPVVLQHLFVERSFQSGFALETILFGWFVLVSFSFSVSNNYS